MLLFTFILNLCWKSNNPLLGTYPTWKHISLLKTWLVFEASISGPASIITKWLDPGLYFGLSLYFRPGSYFRIYGT